MNFCSKILITLANYGEKNIFTQKDTLSNRFGRIKQYKTYNY